MSSTADTQGGFLSRRALATVSIMLATIMQAVDSTIANVALPTIQGAMSATHDQASWVLTSYIIAAAIMTAPAGYLASRFGRRKLFLVSVFGFTLTSMLCGMATTIEELVLYRILQGMFGAALVPMSQAVLLDTYPREQHGRAMAIWGVGIMIGPILGPTLGGYITEWLDWRWVFFINLPIGIITFYGLYKFVDETTKNQALMFDWRGFLLLSIAVGSFQLMLDRGETLDWFAAREIIVEALLAGLCFYLFVVHSLTSDRPFINMELFRDKNYVTGLVMIFSMGIILLATMALLPPFLVGLLGYPVDLVGEVMAPRGLGTMVSMMIAGRLVSRMDPRILIATGLCLSTLSLWDMSQFTLNITPWHVIQSGFLQGLGLGLVIVPMSTMSYATLPMTLRNEGTALYSLVRNLGSSFGLSVVIAQLSNKSQAYHSELVTYITGHNIQDWTGGARDLWGADTIESLALLDRAVNAQAMNMAYVDAFQLIMIASAVVIPLLLLMRPPDYQAQQAG